MSSTQTEAIGQPAQLESALCRVALQRIPLVLTTESPTGAEQQHARRTPASKQHPFDPDERQNLKLSER
jgi:hypothetical protein